MKYEHKNILLLLSKNDVPFPEAQVSIHQPTLKEIAFIGEENFFNALRFLNFKRDRFFTELPKELENKTDFEIMMLLLSSKQPVVQKEAVAALLTLLFPNHEVRFAANEIILLNRADAANMIRLNVATYESFTQILTDMFCLDDEDLSGRDYNASDGKAQRIVEKLRKGKERVARQKNGDFENSKGITLLASYASILATGKSISLNEVMDYTVYQLKTEIKRYRLKVEYDIYIKAKLAGAKDLQTPDDWMGTDIFFNNK